MQALFVQTMSGSRDNFSTSQMLRTPVLGQDIPCSPTPVLPTPVLPTPVSPTLDKKSGVSPTHIKNVTF